MSAPEQDRPVKPVLGNPDLSPEYYDENTDEPRNWSVGWDLSWGCKVTIGHEDDGSLRATVSVSDLVKRDGIDVRRVTREQVLDYAALLVQLVSGDPEVERLRAKNGGTE